MNAHFRRMGWGLALVLIDVRINTFDLLPDAIGYGMLFFAMDDLERSFPGYRIPSFWAKALTIAAIPELFTRFDTTGTLVYASVIQLMLLFMIYTFLTVLERHAAGSASEPFLASIRSRRRFFALASGAMLLLTPFSLNWPEAMQPPLVILSVLTMIALVIVLFTCRNAAKELPSEPL